MMMIINYVSRCKRLSRRLFDSTVHNRMTQTLPPRLRHIWEDQHGLTSSVEGVSVNQYLFSTRTMDFNLTFNTFDKKDVACKNAQPRDYKIHYVNIRLLLQNKRYL